MKASPKNSARRSVRSPGLIAFVLFFFFQSIAVGKLIVVMGSSVALGYGSSPSNFNNGSYINGYAGLMTALLTPQGWTVTNISIGTQSTDDGVARFQMDLVPLAPNDVLIGYSLANQGLHGSSDPAGTVNTFTSNLATLISLCRSNGFNPVIGLCYPDNLYTASEYAYLKSANLTLNSFDIPSINFLGAVDDGNGHWVNTYSFDSLHPDNAGHQEMFYSIVPTLFDALAAGKTNSPQLAVATRFARLTRDAGVSVPISFTPSNTLHSFTVSFRVRSTNSGTIAAVRSGTNYATVEIRADKLVYVSTNAQEISLSVNATNDAWHDVVLTYRYALGQTLFIVDGAVAGSLPEQYVPDQFVLGGPAGASGRPATPLVVDLQNWCVYRAAWSTDEALAQRQGNLQQASMEICAALDDASFASGSPVTNRAQSLSSAIVNTAHLIAFPPPAQMGRPANGVATIQFFGTPPNNYVVQTTTNLSGPWVPVNTNTPATDGSLTFTDSNATNNQRYYRMVSP
jgi:lysophospholipase L1-like esterase